MIGFILINLNIKPGAAGLDSSIFAHLKRNWTWNNSANYRKGDKIANPPFSMSEMEGERSVTITTEQVISERSDLVIPKS